MTNINEECNAFITKRAKELGKTKRYVIEEALESLALQLEKMEIEESFRKMGEDKEYLEELRQSAESDMPAYWAMIKDMPYPTWNESKKV